MATRRDFTFHGNGRALTAYYAEPEHPAGADPGAPLPPHPAVLVVHEIFGLNDDIRRIATRFADNGYVALAPDLVGAGFKPLCIARFMQGMSRVSSGRPYREMRAFHDWLAQRRQVDPDRIGMAGFCAGGGFAILYAARGQRELRAVAPFYARLPADESVIPDVCPTVASYGGRDRSVGANGPRLEAALEAAGIPHDVKTYPDAGHSFMNQHEGPLGALMRRGPSSAGFRPEASEDAWGRMLAFFDQHLAPRGPAEPEPEPTREAAPKPAAHEMSGQPLRKPRKKSPSKPKPKPRE
jgi:carboxymethylenebutenolidase